jgi:hypothetical protein
MAIRNDTYAAVRAEVGTLLTLSARMFELEQTVSGTSRAYETFDDARRVGTLALATICHRHPEARKMLQQTINNHAREVELLQQKRRPANGKS